MLECVRIPDLLLELHILACSAVTGRSERHFLHKLNDFNDFVDFGGQEFSNGHSGVKVKVKVISRHTIHASVLDVNF